jgi:hypothetical protein
MAGHQHAGRVERRVSAYDRAGGFVAGTLVRMRDAKAYSHECVEGIELPADKPWGLREMQLRDPDGLSIVIVEVPATHPLRHR